MESEGCRIIGNRKSDLEIQQRREKRRHLGQYPGRCRMQKKALNKGLLHGVLPVVLSAGLCLSGCKVQYEKEAKIADLEYEVVERASEIPESVEEMISRQGGAPYMLTISDGETLYIARGYGSDQLPGCTVTAEEVYETEHAVCIRTRIMGPDLREKHAGEADGRGESGRKESSTQVRDNEDADDARTETSRKSEDGETEKDRTDADREMPGEQEESGEQEKPGENPGILIRLKDPGKEVVFL